MRLGVGERVRGRGQESLPGAHLGADPGAAPPSLRPAGGGCLGPCEPACLSPVRTLSGRAGPSHREPAQFGHRGTCPVCWAGQADQPPRGPRRARLAHSPVGGLSSPGDPWELKHRGVGTGASTATWSGKNTALVQSSRGLQKAVPEGQQTPPGSGRPCPAVLGRPAQRAGRESTGLGVQLWD